MSRKDNQNQVQPAPFQKPEESSSSLEDIVKNLALSTAKLEQHISRLEQNAQAVVGKFGVQIGQLVDPIAQREPGKFPSQIMVNPKRPHGNFIS